MTYGGPLEFVFVVESADDPALPMLHGLAERQRVHKSSGPPVTVRTVVAGPSTNCSQKAHNLCAGVEACDPRVASEGGYVLCLDDDVALHPGTVGELVAELEADPAAFVATGFPFDIVPPGASFPAHLTMSFHLPMQVFFGAWRDAPFAWGGCMLLRGRELLPGDPRGLLAAWRCGGYSDDLILTALCKTQRLPIRAPAFAVFPQRLDPSIGWRSWFNYFYRQLFCMDTYANGRTRCCNLGLAVVCSTTSWLIVLPSLAGLVSLVRWALLGALASVAVALQGLASDALALQHHSLSGGVSCSSSSNEAGVALTACGAGVSGSSWTAAASWLARAAGPLPAGALALLLGWAAAHAGLVFMTVETLALFRVLSPGRDAVPLSCFRWPRVWAAIMLTYALLPALLVYAHIAPTVEWSGVVYRKHKGRVTPIWRRPAAGAAAATATAAIAPTAAGCGEATTAYGKRGVPASSLVTAGCAAGALAWRALRASCTPR